MAEEGSEGRVRRIASDALRRLGRAGTVRRAFDSVVGWVDDGARAELAFLALSSLGAEQRLDFARRLCTSTGGAGATRVVDLMRACFEGAPAEAIEDVYQAIAEQALHDPHTLEYALSLARRWMGHLPRFGATLEGARILELGPGYTLSCGIALHCHGAATYVGADLFPLVSSATVTYRRLRARLAERPLVLDPALAARALARFDRAVDLAGPDVRFPTGAVAHRHPVDAAELPFPDGAFDVVISNASFEHFRDPARAARECARVTARGGLGLHQIDLRDHRDFTRPLDFLTFTADAWEARFPIGAFEYTNRLRRGELAALFQAAGQEILALDVGGRHPVDEELRARLDPRYRALPDEELSAVACLFTVRRT